MSAPPPPPGFPPSTSGSPSAAPSASPSALPPPPSAVAALPSPSGTTLPNSTVVALGIGFVAAALCVVLLTLLARIHQVRQAVRRARADGEDTDFADMWDRLGGWWGVIGSGELGYPPPRVPTLYERGWRMRTGCVVVPKVTDVDVARVATEAKRDLMWAEAQPLSVASTSAPGAPDALAVSVLILLPEDPTGPPPAYDGDDPPLPYLCLGTTHAAPSAPLAAAGIAPPEPDDMVRMHMLERVEPPPPARLRRAPGAAAGPVPVPLPPRLDPVDHVHRIDTRASTVAPLAAAVHAAAWMPDRWTAR